MSTEKIDEGGVADLLAKSQQLSAPVEGTSQPLNTEKAPTPEEAIALLEAHEAKEITEQGVVGEKPDVEGDEVDLPKKEDELDLTGMSLDEQIEALTNKKAEEEAKANPLKQVETKIEDAGLNLSDMAQEYVEKGELTAETIKSLNDAGFDNVAIDAYITTKVEGATAKANEAITSICGSQDSFNEMSEWMQTGVSAEEFNAYNQGIQGENYKLHLENMYNKFEKAQPQKQTLVRQSGKSVARTSDTQGYANQSEMITAMNHPSYGKNLEYTREVQRKVSLMR